MIQTPTPDIEGRPIREYHGADGGMLMVSVSGTAVSVR